MKRKKSLPFFNYRFASLVVMVILFQTHRPTDGLVVQGDLNKALYGHSFLNISGITMENCLERCLANCLCLSFQICGSECQLCSSNKYSKPQAMHQINSCTSYNFRNQDDIEISNQQCGRGCTNAINCCMTSNPCLNDGICLPSSPHNLKRFRCKCPDGHVGERCEHCKPGYTGRHCDQPIKSCRGYSNGSRTPGNYTVFDDSMEHFQVFCDFDGNSSMTWTLVQSYKLGNKNDFMMALSIDSPKNNKTTSWFRYRLSKSAVYSIHSDSTEWRLTCRYETDGVVYKDYVRALNTKVNILTYTGFNCVNVEYINVRGHNCTNCTARFWQKDQKIIHFDSYYSNICSFDVSGSALRCGGLGEDNFGFYDCINNKHRCSSSSEATTQTWFGG